MSIFTKSPEPFIAYFEVVWYKILINEHENVSGFKIWGQQVDYARNVNLISTLIMGLFGIWN